MPFSTLQHPSPLVRYLLGDDSAVPSLEELRSTGLIGHAFTRLPDHPHRSALRDGFLVLSARHMMARKAIAELLRAWGDAHVIGLVFKGFHLAEFVYPVAGQRGYADVDILVTESDVGPACRIAATTGWTVAWKIGHRDGLLTQHGPEYRGHEAAHLMHEEIGLRIDLHRRIVHNIHNRMPPGPVPRRLSEAVVAAAETIVWEGAPLRLPRPVDAVVFGLALNRCWGSDAWRVKPRDYADLQALATRHGLTRRDVMARASALGVARTVGTFLDRCDLETGRLELSAPTWWALRWWNLRASRERGPVDPVRAGMALADATCDALVLAQVLPAVIDTRRRARRDAPSSAAPSSIGVKTRPRIGPRGWRRLRRAIHRSMRLLKVPEGERDALAVLSAFGLLHARGIAVSLVSDDSRGGGKQAPRLEHEGRQLRVVAHGTPEN